MQASKARAISNFIVGLKSEKIKTGSIKWEYLDKNTYSVSTFSSPVHNQVINICVKCVFERGDFLPFYGSTAYARVKNLYLSPAAKIIIAFFIC